MLPLTALFSQNDKLQSRWDHEDNETSTKCRCNIHDSRYLGNGKRHDQYYRHQNYNDDNLPIELRHFPVLPYN